MKCSWDKEIKQNLKFNEPIIKPYRDIPSSHIDMSIGFDDTSGKNTSRIISDKNLLSGLDGSGNTLKDKYGTVTPIPLKDETS